MGRWRSNIQHLERLKFLSLFQSHHLMVRPPANRFKIKPILSCSSYAISALHRTIYYYAMMPLSSSEKTRAISETVMMLEVHWQINPKNPTEKRTERRRCGIPISVHFTVPTHRTNCTKTSKIMRCFFFVLFYLCFFHSKIVWVMPSSISHKKQLAN